MIGAGVLGVFLLFEFIGELFSDFNLILKIFVLITVISFVKNHVQGPLAVVIIIGVAGFILFDMWWFFGGIYLLYTMLTLGISSVLIDFFFTSGMSGGGAQKGASPEEMLEKAAHRKIAQHAVARRMHR